MAPDKKSFVFLATLGDAMHKGQLLDKEYQESRKRMRPDLFFFKHFAQFKSELTVVRTMPFLFDFLRTIFDLPSLARSPP